MTKRKGRRPGIDPASTPNPKVTKDDESPRRNRFIPLQMNENNNDQMPEDEADDMVLSEAPKKLHIPPIKVLELDTALIHATFSINVIKQYSVKKMSIVHKILCESMEVYDKTIDMLKKIKWQFFTHESKHNRPFKAVLYGLHDVKPDQIKCALIAKVFKCIEVKQVIKRYQNSDFADYIYIVYFETGVKLNVLKSHCSTLFNTVVRWDYQRSIKNRVVQCRNCQMYGHGEKGCHVKTLCANCAGSHKTSLCNVSSHIKCAHCAGNHKANDNSCANRALYQQLRDKVRVKQRALPNASVSFQRGFNISNATDFPALARNSNSVVNTHSVVNNAWQNSRNANINNFNDTNNVNNHNINNNNGSLFSPSDIGLILTEMLPMLSECRTKEQQFYVITQMAVKFLYNDVNSNSYNNVN